MKVNSHSGQETRGEGGSGGRGEGGVWFGGGGAPGGAPAAARTMFTEPQAGQVKRPGPGTSNWLRQDPHRTITGLFLLLDRRLLRWTLDIRLPVPEPTQCHLLSSCDR